MGFMRSDEFILLMNYNSTIVTDATYIATVDERIKLHDAGISTAIEYPRWRGLEPEKGKYNFSVLENVLEMNRKANTKTILSVCGSELPDWMPNSWFVRQQDGKIRREVLSLWNREAQDYLWDYYNTLLTKFSAPDVLFVLGEYMEGEAILPCEPSFYDKHALKDYRRYNPSTPPDINHVETRLWLEDVAISHLLSIQSLFVKQHNEIWNMQQWLMNQWSAATINYAQPLIIETYRDAFPDTNIVLLQYTYFDEDHPKENEDYVDNIRNKFGCDVIVEAHFCTGLKETTPKAIAKGFKGQILCPVHIMSGYDRIEDWMYLEIKNSHRRWSNR